ncbi:white, partial [Diabrotica virgifera virgifera]
MEQKDLPSFAKLKINKRPDSLKLELLTIPENTYVNQFDNRVVNVGFRNISYTVKEGIFKTRSRVILDSINGDFSGGELTAIMGPSGAGKTMLLNILAGYTSKGVLGEKLINDKPRNELAFQRKSCYIMQDDDLQPLLTVSESMTIAASLKMSSKYTWKEKKNR